ncbi:leucine-rich repeat and WD repeat-containing protein 1 isoform 2-T2 [Pelodytes ibericus]
MPKLSVDLLLKKGLPKSTSLQDVKKLNLSKMNLESKDINPKLFSQMINLEELDISRNLISEIPSNLKLHSLRVLNFSDNQVEEISVLKQFPNLEEVLYEENLYLTISDNHKVFCLLPKLRRLNNKDITSLANHFRFVNHRELSSRVELYWEKNYKTKLPKDPSMENMKVLRKEFLKTVVGHVRYGPNSLKDFTKWKDLEKSSKRKLNLECLEGSPAKRLRIKSDVASLSLSPRRSTKLQDSPLKITPNKQKQGNADQGQHSESKLAKVPKAVLKSTPTKTLLSDDKTLTNGKQNRSQREPKNKKELNLEPLHFIQCHSKNNSCEDFSTQLWAGAFEPELDPPSSQVVATCGGDSVCLIDCEIGKVLKKYKVTGEEFFALAWTTVTMISNEGQKRKINVLAAGGKLGVVKLIHSKINLAYGEIKAHKKAISIMCFSPKQETFLFTGSYDRRILLWDIGVPDCEYNFRASPLLTLDTTSTPLRICPVPACPDQYLLAGCEDGCFVWDIKLTKNQGKRSCEVEFHFPIYKNEAKKSDFHIVDGLAFLNDDLVASKSAAQGSIYIWSWEKSFKAKKSKGNRKLDAVILIELKWSDTDLPYISLTSSPVGLCVFCGDESGKVWIYDLESSKAELMNCVQSKILKQPTKILNWPSLATNKNKVDGSSINTVAVDSTFKYLVALTDRNIIAIWKTL